MWLALPDFILFGGDGLLSGVSCAPAVTSQTRIREAWKALLARENGRLRRAVAERDRAVTSVSPCAISPERGTDSRPRANLSHRDRELGPARPHEGEQALEVGHRRPVVGEVHPDRQPPVEDGARGHGDAALLRVGDDLC